LARRSGGFIEDIVEIAVKLPWWIGVSCSVFSFVLLHWFAGKELPAAAGGKELSRVVLPGLLHSLANFGQIIVPAAFFLGATISLGRKVKRAKLYARTSRSTSPACLSDMSWRDFEYLVGEYFRHRHFSVTETKDGPDGGVDLIATKERETYFIQCKHWQAEQVGVKVVRELLGVMTSAGATGGIVVTSGEFTKDAAAFARANKIVLLDGRELLRNIQSEELYTGQPSGKSGGMLKIIRWTLAGLLVISLCLAVYHFSETGKSLLPRLSSQIQRLFTGGRRPHGVNGTPPNTTEKKEFIFTDEQVKKAKDEVLREKQHQQTNLDTAQGQGEEGKFIFEIELVNGEWIYTDNATVTDNYVTYTSAYGAVVSLHRSQVKTMQRRKIAN